MKDKKKKLLKSTKQWFNIFIKNFPISIDTLNVFFIALILSNNILQYVGLIVHNEVLFSNAKSYKYCQHFNSIINEARQSIRLFNITINLKHSN